MADLIEEVLQHQRAVFGVVYLGMELHAVELLVGALHRRVKAALGGADDLEAGRLVPVLGGWHRPSHQNYVVCKDDDWKIRQIRMFSNWWAQKLGDYEKECEARLIKLYGRKFFLNLIH